MNPEDEHYCSSGCPRPEPADLKLRHYALNLVWWLWEVITWPWTVRQLRKAGFVRTGWMTWTTPDD